MILHVARFLKKKLECGRLVWEHKKMRQNAPRLSLRETARAAAGRSAKLRPNARSSDGGSGTALGRGLPGGGPKIRAIRKD